MKRLHVHIIVRDLDDSIHFYKTLFDAEPSVLKDDYAKWMLDDPRVNFAISARGGVAGINHLGVQVEADELAALTGRLQSAGRAVAEQSDAACCYAKSDKTWIEDPQGVRWEAFRAMALPRHPMAAIPNAMSTGIATLPRSPVKL